MDFINLNTEYESLNQLAKHGVTSLSNFNSFLKTKNKYLDMYYLNTKKANETMFSELLKFDSKSSLSKNFFDFYRSYENFSIKLKNIMAKLDKELIEPNTLFSKHLSGKYQECLTEFKSLAYSTFESKKNLERSKHKYFDSCKLAVEQEKVVLKVMNDKDKNLATDEEIAHAHDILIKLRLQAENNCQVYKSELLKTNKLFEENEKKYFPVIEKMKLNEESRENFLKYHFEKYIKILEEFTAAVCELYNRMNNSILEIKVDDDMKLLSDKLNFLYRNNERIPREEFLNYDIYRRNLEKMLSNSQIPGISSNNLIINHTTDAEYPSTTSSNLSTSISNTDTTHNSNDQDDLITSFFTTLKEKSTEISIEELTKLLENLESNISFSKLFIDRLLVHYKQNLFIEVPNYQNIHHLANILLTITNNTEIKKELFEMNFAIIYIAEKTFYTNPDNMFNKIYLCKILSRNKIYNDKKFWLNLMNIKINSFIENRIQSELQKREREVNSNAGNSVTAEPPSSPRNSGGAGLLSLGSRVKNLFSLSIIKENKKIESSMIHTSIYEQIKTNEATNVVKEYILHFANFSFDVSEAIDIIVELSHSYNYDKEKVSFFISLLNSNLFTIKNKPLVKMHNIDYNNAYKDYKDHVKLNDNCVSIFACALKYLEVKDLPSVLMLNKSFNKKLSRIVYKNVLFKYHNMNSSTRIAIWKNILNIHELKRHVNYAGILKQMEETDQSALIEPIWLDVMRTSFDGNNMEFKRAAILNILKAVAFTKPNINYCQGMNYIAAFLFQLTNDEEESFYFLYAILTSTDYGAIFLNDLAKLKQFFYVFDRLLFLYLPELHIYFKNNSILVSYYISPWFITLFTNSYQHVNNSLSPKILIRIWDEFLLNGWKSIIKSGLCLIKNYEQNLLNLKYEELLHFLINDIMKYGFFQNSNYDNFINITKNVKLQAGLLSNLENECYLELKAKEMEDKKKEEQKKMAYEKEHAIKI